MNATIAVPVEGDQIFQHFGKATKFKIYTIEEDVVKRFEVLDTEGAGHEDLAFWLLTHGVNAVVCGGIGPGAQGALVVTGIAALAGVEGSADEAVAKLIAGTLETQSTSTCGGHHGGGCHGHCGGHCGHCHG